MFSWKKHLTEFWNSDISSFQCETLQLMIDAGMADSDSK
jgi:hypothetical protein